MIKYDDVATQTTEEYFNNNQFSIDVFNKKYRVDNETYIQTIKRVCDAIASVEKTKELQKYWGERWFDEIYNDWWHPAGSIMQGAGSNKNISLANCTTISLGVNSNENWDNLESIIKNTAYTVAKTAAYRQGLGVDFSALRPRETSVYNSSNESTGAVHWMRFIDQIAMFVGQKGRIPAFLFSINCSHPDVIEFIKAKSDYHSIQNANISVQCTDALYEAAEKDENWTLSFTIPEIKAGEKVYIDVHSIDLDSQKDDGGYYYVAKKSRPKETITKTVKAREILELIAKGMCNYAEPGIQNIDIARKYSNSDYVYDPSAEYDSRILSSNACVTGDTEIITKNGYMPIVNLINQEVEIWNGFEWSKVIPKITNHNQKILKFTFSDGRELKTTYYHEFILPVDYTNKTKRVKAIDLKVGDKITKTEFPLLNEGVFFKDAYTQGFICSNTCCRSLL
jgi:ribonucleoside-diphosphate reductase alpha chain